MEPETQRAGEETQAMSEQEKAQREEADERARYTAQKRPAAWWATVSWSDQASAVTG